ncbi:hypothetical protein ACOSP7_018719 [Xanthoceras sorbifolium]
MAGGFAAPDADEALRRLKEKRKGKNKTKLSGSIEPMTTPPPPPPLPSRGKEAFDMGSVGRKRRRDDSTTGSEASVDLAFPQDASAYSNFGSIMPQVERLLLPEDESTLKEIGLSQAFDWELSHQCQVLQSHIYAKQELGSTLRKVRKLKLSDQGLRVEVEKMRVASLEAKKTADEASRRATEATLELEHLKSEVDKLKPL